MLQVRTDLCIGCGVCMNNCPQGTISLQVGKAWIDQARCSNCGICANICPQGAIIEFVPVSKAGLSLTIGTLKQKADDIIERIERLR